jgi:hypothetical protein
METQKLKSHEEKIIKISDFLRNRTSKAPLSLRKKTVSHQVPKSGVSPEEEKLDVSDLNEILEINEKEQTCTAEPGVTFSDLVNATLKYHLVPIIVPELKTITIG